MHFLSATPTVCCVGHHEEANALPGPTDQRRTTFIAPTKMRSVLFTLIIQLLSIGAEPAWEDSPALTALWQASNEGSTDAYIAQIIQNREVLSHRSADGRGPMFWAYEFKNVDARALLMHLEVSPDQQDSEGKAPKEFFPESEAERSEFDADAKAKVEELGKLLAEREEEFYAYQNSAPADDDDDYDDEDDDEGAPKKTKPPIDSIDYADDEDEEDDNKDEM